jgi:ABC-type transport system involved in multi-copper enzyme maturation permease subunit
MPIYDQGYRGYEARQPLRRIRFWPITREAARALSKRPALLVLAMLAWLPLVARLVQVFVVSHVPAVSEVMSLDTQLFGQFLHWQSYLAVLLTIFGASGLIATDLRSGGILVYLARPLTRRDYLLGKLAVTLGLNLGTTLLPALLLYFAALLIAPRVYVRWELAWIAPAIAVASLVLSLPLSLAALAVSALSRSARVAGLSLLALLLGTDLACAILSVSLGWRTLPLLSMLADARSLTAGLFGAPQDLPALPALLVLALFVAAAFAVLRVRVRAYEVVK